MLTVIAVVIYFSWFIYEVITNFIFNNIFCRQFSVSNIKEVPLHNVPQTLKNHISFMADFWGQKLCWKKSKSVD